MVTDVEPKRLAFAAEFVPGCVTYRVDPGLGAEANAAGIRGLFGADGDEYCAPATVLECTGVESSVCTAAFAVRRGGVVCVIGVGRAVMNNLPFMHISLAEVSISDPASSNLTSVVADDCRSTFGSSTGTATRGRRASRV